MVSRETSPDEIVSHLDLDTLGAILSDVVKVGTKTGRGARELPDLDVGLRRLRGYLDRYQVTPFVDAFRVLTNHQSTRGIAARTGLSRSHVQRLLAGCTEPTMADMECIAAAYKQPAAWFAEYRATMIAELVKATLLDNPERSAALARKLLT